MFDKKDVSKLLENIADKLEFLNENKYRVIAFRNGADAIKKSRLSVEKLIKEKKLSQVKGIGKGLEGVIYEFYKDGYSTLYNELLIEVPEEIEKLLKIKLLTPKKIKLLHSELSIKNLEDLEEACLSNKLSTVKGFDKNLQEEILKQIELLKHYANYVLLSVGYRYSSLVKNVLAKCPSVVKYQPTAEMRRGMEIISSVQFVVLVSKEDKFKKELSEFYDIKNDNGRILIRDKYLVPIILYPVFDEEEFVLKLIVTTGTEEFLQEFLRTKSKIKSSISKNSEEEVFKSFGAPYVIPEMREAEYFKTKEELRTNSDIIRDRIKGLLHFHSDYSDGKTSLENMIMHAEKLGFQYATICDHSKFAHYANGLKEERIFQQTKELKQLTSKIKLQLFQGIECDILKNGSLDYDADFMSNFDFVVASIHKRFNLDEREMTARLIKAIENPHTDLLGHPSGRFLLQRAPYEFNTKKIIDACAENKVAIEINSNPKRLDIDWRWIYYAREKGCLFSINPDAHSIEEINFINFGIKMGRKGGLQSYEVINCFDVKDFKKFLKRKIKRKFKIS